MYCFVFVTIVLFSPNVFSSPLPDPAIRMNIHVDANKISLLNLEEFVLTNISKPPILTVWYNGSVDVQSKDCLLYTSPSPRDRTRSRMPSSA